MKYNVRKALEREVLVRQSGAAPELANGPAPHALPGNVLAMLPPSAAKRFVPTADPDTPAELWAVASLIRAHLLPAEAIACFTAISIAPGVPVDPARLRWHPGLSEIVYVPSQPLPLPDDGDDPDGSPPPWPSPEGRYVRLSAVSNLLRFNTVATGWMQDGDDNSASRFSVELSATVKIMRVSVALHYTPWLLLREQTGPGDRFVVRTEEEMLDLVDIDDPEYVPQFRTLREAMRLADAAILHEVTLPDGFDPYQSGGAPRLRWLQARPRPRWWRSR